MNSRWFNLAVVGLWLTSMSWLVYAKVFPLLWIGEPPNDRQIIFAQREVPPAGWRLSVNHQVIGWALTQTESLESGLTEIRGRVHFETLPIDEILPAWIRTLVGLGSGTGGQLPMDVRTLLTLDPLGHLVRFNSGVQVAGFNEVIKVRGTVDGHELQLVVTTGGESFTADPVPLPANSLLSDAISPQTQLPGLREGQKWTIPIYNPLWPNKRPVEILMAEVEGYEPFTWDGAVEDVSRVVYRSIPWMRATRKQAPRGTLWVRADGAVVRQQARLFDATLTFDRLPNAKAAELTTSAGGKWWLFEQPFPIENDD